MAGKARLRSGGVQVPLDVGEYDDPTLKSNQEQHQATGSQQAFVTGPNTFAPSRLTIRIVVTGITPQGCEDAAERLIQLALAADRYYSEISDRFLLLNGRPNISRDKRKGLTSKQLTIDWPLRDPYWHEEGETLPSTRLSP